MWWTIQVEQHSNIETNSVKVFWLVLAVWNHCDHLIKDMEENNNDGIDGVTYRVKQIRLAASFLNQNMIIMIWLTEYGYGNHIDFYSLPFWIIMKFPIHVNLLLIVKLTKK